MIDQVDDPELVARYAGQKAEDIAVNIKNMTTMQRLMTSGSRRTMSVAIPDGDDEIIVTLHVPVMSQLDSLARSFSTITATTNPKNQKEIDAARNAEDTIYKVLGHLCTDPELDYSFWKSGLYPLHVLYTTYMGILNGVNTIQVDAKSFRAK